MVKIAVIVNLDNSSLFLLKISWMLFGMHLSSIVNTNLVGALIVLSSSSFSNASPKRLLQSLIFSPWLFIAQSMHSFWSNCTYLLHNYTNSNRLHIAQWMIFSFKNYNSVISELASMNEKKPLAQKE